MNLSHLTKPFQAPAEPEHESELLRELKGRAREQEQFDVAPILGLTGKREVIFRVPTQEEQELALAGAHAHAAERMGSTPEAANDTDLLQNAKSAFILAKMMREAKDGGALPVFMNGKVLAQHLSADKIGALLRCANMVRAKYQPWPNNIDEETVNGIIAACAAATGSDIPERILAGCTDVTLAQLVILLSAKIETLRAEVDMVHAELERAHNVIRTLSTSTSDTARDA